MSGRATKRRADNLVAIANAHPEDMQGKAKGGAIYRCRCGLSEAYRKTGAHLGDCPLRVRNDG